MNNLLIKAGLVGSLVEGAALARHDGEYAKWFQVPWCWDEILLLFGASKKETSRVPLFEVI